MSKIRKLLHGEAGVKRRGREVSVHAKVPSARKSLSHKRERGKKVDSTLLDVKASTLQHVGQPYTVGRAGSTRNKETTKASIRKRFELADVRILFLISFFSFFSFPHRINFPASLSTPMLVLRRQQGVEHCRSRDIIATISNLCVWYNLRQEKGTRPREDRKEHLLQDRYFLLFRRSEHDSVTNLEMPKSYKHVCNS